MAIGLEIEVNVPIDQLSVGDIGVIAGVHALPAPTLAQKLDTTGRRDVRGKVDYGVILQAAAGGYRVEADHDDRVSSHHVSNGNVNWPLHEGSRDSIIEIIMDPPAVTGADITNALAAIAAFTTSIDNNTLNLTTHWVGALPATATPRAINMGPLDTSIGNPATRQAHHGFQGSIQVNVGVDLREYHSLLKWYVSSDYSLPSRVPHAERPLYQQIRSDMTQAVDVGRAKTNQIMGQLSSDQKAAAGNCRGLRGLLTHLALYLIRGKLALGDLGGSPKNLAPALMKSPNTIAATYGMTAYEVTYYTNNRDAIVRDLLARCGRAILPVTALNTVGVFAARPGLNVDTLSNLATATVPLAGTPVLTPTGVGPLRTGSLAVRTISTVAPGPGVIGITGANSRGGLVVEFRCLPGFYDGPVAWENLANDFFAAADARNQRNGISP